MSGYPLVSVVIPLYNAEAFVEQALLSLLSQSYLNFEVLLVDDASSDGSLRKVKHMDLPKNFRLFRNEQNRGAGFCLNWLIERASGSLVAIMHADDVSHEVRLAKQVEYLDSNQNIGVVGSWAWQIDSKGNKVRLLKQATDSVSIQRLMWRQCPLIHPTVMFRKSILEQFPYSDSRVAEDYELWMRLAKAGIQISNIPEPLLDYRVHAAQTSCLKQVEERDVCYRIFRDFYSLSDLTLEEYNSVSFKVFDLSVMQHLRALRRNRKPLGISRGFPFIDSLKYWIVQQRSRTAFSREGK